MSTLYLVEQGAKLTKTSERLVVEKDGNILAEIPAFKVERILIYGNVQITTQALVFLLERGIDTSFLSIYGRFRGRLVPKSSKNVILRVAQFDKTKDEKFKLEFARRIIEAKIKNACTVLTKYASNHPEVDFTSYIFEMKRYIRVLERKEKISTLLGVEGQASAVYFTAFSKMIRTQLEFKSRSKRPPKDPVNSLLSFCYTLLTSEVDSVLSAIGFDTYVGYLHGINYGRPSLALDMVEEFRHIAERFTLFLINNEVIKPDDFEVKNEGFYLVEKARREFFAQYEKRMLKKFHYPKLNKNVNYREMFYYQGYNLAKAVQEDKEYTPFLLTG